MKICTGLEKGVQWKAINMNMEHEDGATDDGSPKSQAGNGV